MVQNKSAMPKLQPRTSTAQHDMVLYGTLKLLQRVHNEANGLYFSWLCDPLKCHLIIIDYIMLLNLAKKCTIGPCFTIPLSAGFELQIDEIMNVALTLSFSSSLCSARSSTGRPSCAKS